MGGRVLLRVENLTKTFRVRESAIGGKIKKVKAVDRVSLEIREGGNLILVGESGSGKSTLGRLTLGLLKPTSGTVYYYGKDIWSMSKEEYRVFRRNAQIIHQDPYSSVNPVKNIYQVLSAPLFQHRIVRNAKEAYKRSAELLELVGLVPPADFLKRYPSRISGGQLQRISIARAISLRPKYIVADEAVSMLDASLRLGILDLLVDLQKKFGISYLFITHDLGIARYFVYRAGGDLAVMYLGSIVELGGGEEVMAKPLHPYTRILVEASPVPDPKVARSRGLPALRSLDIPSLTEVPPGCKFHTRCPYAKKICEERVPELRSVGGRLVACHFAEIFI